MKESEIQKSIMEYLGYQKDIYFFRAASGGFKTQDYKGKTSFFRTGKPGCPDIVVCKDGKFIGLEVKTDKGRQSEHQKQAAQEIINASSFVFNPSRI